MKGEEIDKIIEYLKFTRGYYENIREYTQEEMSEEVENISDLIKKLEIDKTLLEIK